MSKTKKLCLDAMGVALFVVLTMCVQVPVFENYYLCLGYIAMAFYTYFLGTKSGAMVGTLGCILYCLITSGLRGMPGWALGNLVIAVICGIVCRMLKKYDKKSIKLLVINIAVIVSVAIGILVVKSSVEVVLYGIPFLVRAATNSFAFVADVIVLMLGFSICVQYENVIRKQLKF